MNKLSKKYRLEYTIEGAYQMDLYNTTFKRVKEIEKVLEAEEPNARWTNELRFELEQKKAEISKQFSWTNYEMVKVDNSFSLWKDMTSTVAACSIEAGLIGFGNGFLHWCFLGSAEMGCEAFTITTIGVVGGACVMSALSTLQKRVMFKRYKEMFKEDIKEYER